MKHTIDINTILHTKDGREIGNAIVVKKQGSLFTIKTDYGNEVEMTIQEIDRLFYIAYSSFTKEIEGLDCNDCQKIVSSTHKYRVEIK